MSFTASANRIKVTDGTEIVFDTNTPMPHIVQTITGNVTHTFSNATTTTSQAYGFDYQSFSCPVDSYDSCAYSYYDSCAYSYYSSCATYEYNYSFGSFGCVGGEVCFGGTVCEAGWVTTYNNLNFLTCTKTNSALDESDTYTIGTLSNSAQADFLIVVCNGNRTTAGSDITFGSFVTAIPINQNFTANGSTILESAFQGGGASWLRRIMHVYPDGSDIKVDFKHSSVAETANVSVTQACDPFSPVCTAGNRPISSTFDLDFTVYAGKFTQ